MLLHVTKEYKMSNSSMPYAYSEAQRTNLIVWGRRMDVELNIDNSIAFLSRKGQSGSVLRAPIQLVANVYAITKYDDYPRDSILYSAVADVVAACARDNLELEQALELGSYMSLDVVDKPLAITIIKDMLAAREKDYATNTSCVSPLALHIISKVNGKKYNLN